MNIVKKAIIMIVTMINTLIIHLQYFTFMNLFIKSNFILHIILSDDIFYE